MLINLKVFFVMAAVVFCTCVSSNAAYISDYGKDGNVMVTLFESPEAFPNPMKGFRPGLDAGDYRYRAHEYALTYRQYVKYSDLETAQADTVQKIIDWSNTHWKDLEKQNIKIIPRVVLTYVTNPEDGSNPADNFWPEDFTSGLEQPLLVNRWISDEFKTRIAAFIAKLGEAWDNDQRVAAVELGLWGHWGEHHIWPNSMPNGKDRIPPDIQQVMGDAVSRAFKNKKVMVRYPETFTDYEIGFYWDSFGVEEDSSSGNGIIERDKWKTQMISGEPSYGWGNQTLLGGSPDGNMKSNACTSYLIDWIQKTHTSSLGWVAEYNQKDSKIAANAARVQKAMGYRYVINSAKYNEVVTSTENLSIENLSTENLSIELEISNRGSAPFYYQWPVELSLLNLRKNVVWKQTISADIREWLPGENITISEKFTIPSTIPQGDYILAVSILDPAGSAPSLRFANTNYYNGGRTPVGIIGIGQVPKNQKLGGFDSLKADRSIKYSQELLAGVK